MTVHEDHGDTQEQTDVQDQREAYVAPELKDLGTFQELTEFGAAGVADLEGAS